MNKIKNPLKTMNDCHKDILSQLKKLEKVSRSLKKAADLKKNKKFFADFFRFIDESLALHTRDEEQALFPFLLVKFSEMAGASCGSMTPVEKMTQDHKSVHAALAAISDLSAAVFESKNAAVQKVLLEKISEKGLLVSELLSDHIWKEDNVLYPMAKELLSAKELAKIAGIMASFREECGFSCHSCG